MKTIENIKAFSAKANYRYGMCEVKVKYSPKRLCISYAGNMGANIQSVDNCLENIDLPPVAMLKSELNIHKESGHPEYHYQLELLLK